MIRSFLRTGILAAMLAGALAFAGGALANPTTPHLAPIPPTVFASQLNVTWSPSTFDQGSIVAFYELQVLDFTGGTSTKKAVFGTGTTIGLSANHTYGLRLRAADVAGGQVLYSGSSVDVFNVLPLFRIPIYYNVYFPWPPECLVCGLDEMLRGNDPVISRARTIVASSRVVDHELLAGLYVDARGAVTAVQR